MISKKISSLHSVMQADIDPWVPTHCWYQPCGHLKRIEAYVIEKTRGIGRTLNTPSIGTNPIPYSTEVEQDVKGTTESMISKADYNQPACFISIPPLASSAFLI